MMQSKNAETILTY